MFNFTSTILLHSAKQFRANPSSTDGTKVTGNSGVPTYSNNTLWINGSNLFKKDDIVAIYRNPYKNPVNGKLVVDICSNAVKDAIADMTNPHFRLNFYLRRSGDNNSYYANDFVFKGKDFHYEWTGFKTAAGVAKLIKKINRLYGDIYMNVYVGTGTQQLDNDSTDENMLVFENDNYGLFTEATLEVWEDNYSDCCTFREGGWKKIDELTGDECVCLVDGELNCSLLDAANSNSTNGATLASCAHDKVSVINSSESGLAAAGVLYIVRCENGVGTYDQILRDLRLPTAENFRWNSETRLQDELPVPGNKYVQYTIHQVSPRGILGGSAVGEVTHSKTTHVFFVPSSCCSCSNCEGEIETSNLDAAFLKAIHDAGMDKLLVDVVSGVIGDSEDASARPEKTDPVTAPSEATHPVHEIPDPSDLTTVVKTNNDTEATCGTTDDCECEGTTTTPSGENTGE